MSKNTYWHLSGKLARAGSQVIVELTSDGIAYVWPVNSAILSPIMDPAKEQDLDALLSDGEFLEFHGFFNSIADFMDHTDFSSTVYDVKAIGEFDSIRSCRVAMDEARTA